MGDFVARPRCNLRDIPFHPARRRWFRFRARARVASGCQGWETLDLECWKNGEKMEPLFWSSADDGAVGTDVDEADRREVQRKINDARMRWYFKTTCIDFRAFRLRSRVANQEIISANSSRLFDEINDDQEYEEDTFHCDTFTCCSREISGR